MESVATAGTLNCCRRKKERKKRIGCVKTRNAAGLMVAVASADTRRSFCHHRYQLLPRLLVGPTTRETTDKALTRNKMKKEERILRRPKHSGRHSFSLHLSTLPMRTNYPENADRHTSIVPLQHSPAAFPPFFLFYFFFIYVIMCVCGWKCDAFFPPQPPYRK